VSELAKARLKSGLDVTFANVSLGEANLLLASAENERQAAYANLAAAMGYQRAPRFELAEEPFHLDPLSKDELLATALRERPDLRALDLESQAETKFAKAEAANKYPSVSAFGFAGVIPAGVSQLAGNYTAGGLNVNLPFLNGGLYKARQTEAELRAKAAAERARELETQIVRDLSVALLNVNTAAERVDLTAKLLDQARQALDLAQSRYDLGLSSIVELSQVQLSLTSAAIQQANAKYDYQIQRAILDYQVGLRR
jgi:outer membrane protein